MPAPSRHEVYHRYVNRDGQHAFSPGRRAREEVDADAFARDVMRFLGLPIPSKFQEG